MKAQNDFIKPFKTVYFINFIIPIGKPLFKRFERLGLTERQGLRSRISELYFSESLMERLEIYWCYIFSVLLISPIFLAVFLVISQGDLYTAIWGLIIPALMIYQPESKLKSLLKEKRLSMEKEFPEFSNRLALLVNTGLPVSRAWISSFIVSDEFTPFSYELKITKDELMNGTSEAAAFEAFAKRCKNREITRFVSVLIQNMRKGNHELSMILKIQSSQAWEMRKNAARRLGEEATVKMLFPMILMFIAILIIVVFPGILSLMSVV